MNAKVFERVVSSVAEALNVDQLEVTADKTFQDLGADSLDGVNAIMEIEKEFDIAIPDADMEKFSHIRSIVDYIATNYPEKSGQ